MSNPDHNPLLSHQDKKANAKFQDEMDKERAASTFDASECAQPAFRKTMVWATRKRDEYRIENDAPMPEEKTAELRGRIAMLNELLALDKPTQ